MGLRPGILNPYFDLFKDLEGHSPELLNRIRKKMIWAYSWAVPNLEAIDALAELSPLIEIGAGTGYWAWILRQAGANIRTYDRSTLQPPHWTMIEQSDESVIGQSSARTLFLCWPPLNEGMSEAALARFQGEMVAYVGEWKNGRTGDEGFFERIERDFAWIKTVEIPCFPGFTDKLYVFQRKPNL